MCAFPRRGTDASCAAWAEGTNRSGPGARTCHNRAGGLAAHRRCFDPRQFPLDRGQRGPQLASEPGGSDAGALAWFNHARCGNRVPPNHEPGARAGHPRPVADRASGSGTGCPQAIGPRGGAILVPPSGGLGAQLAHPLQAFSLRSPHPNTPRAPRPSNPDVEGSGTEVRVTFTSSR